MRAPPAPARLLWPWQRPVSQTPLAELNPHPHHWRGTPLDALVRSGAALAPLAPSSYFCLCPARRRVAARPVLLFPAPRHWPPATRRCRPARARPPRPVRPRGRGCLSRLFPPCLCDPRPAPEPAGRHAPRPCQRRGTRQRRQAPRAVALHCAAQGPTRRPVGRRRRQPPCDAPVGRDGPPSIRKPPARSVPPGRVRTLPPHDYGAGITRCARACPRARPRPMPAHLPSITSTPWPSLGPGRPRAAAAVERRQAPLRSRAARPRLIHRGPGPERATRAMSPITHDRPPPKERPDRPSCHRRGWVLSGGGHQRLAPER